MKISKSVSGVSWSETTVNDRDILTLTQKFSINEVLARLLAKRDIKPEILEHFLAPTIKDYLIDPFSLKDMDKAAKLIANSIKSGKKIAIFGDYDVDGATSSAILKIYLRKLGTDPIVYIPDRIAEGYGPNHTAFGRLHDQGVQVIITVDCGIVSFDAIDYGTKLGLEIVIVDHHIGDITLPNAHAIVNPNRFDENVNCGYLAAVGVTFLLIVAINKLLRDEGFFSNRPEPNLLDLLDIVALGTVCDVVPLVGINRAFVAQGLKILANRKNIGLNALAEVSSVKEKITTYHLGYVIGPRINAGGRVGESYLGVDLLTTQEVSEAYLYAKRLDSYNNERRAIEMHMLEDAITYAEKHHSDSHIIFAVGRDWHPGVIGIVASRLKDKYNRPSVVISVESGIGKASARSIDGFDFGAAVIIAKEQGLLLNGGGHAMAAGFSLAEEKINDFHQFLLTNFVDSDKHLKRALTRYYDAEVISDAINVQFVKEVEKLGPFGTSNSEPVFRIKSCAVNRIKIIRDSHIKCMISSKILGKSGRYLTAVAFNAIGTEIGELLLNNPAGKFDIICNLKLSDYLGMLNPEVVIKDVIPHRLEGAISNADLDKVVNNF